MVQKIAVTTEGFLPGVLGKTFDILERKLKSRSNIDVVINGAADFIIRCVHDAAVRKEGYTIQGGDCGITIAASDAKGILYGVGKFLRSSSYTDDGFIPGDWTGTSVPAREVRGMYFATHFHNFYHEAPVNEVVEYIEDLALWGFNALTVWFDMHHFTSVHDPNAAAMIDRLRMFLTAAKSVGMNTGLMAIANEAFADSPQELRADWTSGHDGYTMDLSGYYYVELCPSKDGAVELMLKWRKEVFDAFADIGIGIVWITPYDQGGCTCSACAPWGGNGFIRMGREVAALARECLPGVKINVFTWCFDRFTSGEYQAFFDAMNDEPQWADYVMAEKLFLPLYVGGQAHYPEYVLENGSPGGLPLLGFPEISMISFWPWGGFGANPLAWLIQRIWDDAGHLLSGGFPYSEGIFDDINKVVCGYFYWHGGGDAYEAVREYTGYEYGHEVVDEVLEAVKLLEVGNARESYLPDGTTCRFYNPIDEKDDPGLRYVFEDSSNVEEAYHILQTADKKLDKYVRNSWRWRILYLRSVIDYELTRNDMRVNPRCDDSMAELVEIYHARKGSHCVTPPTTRYAYNRKES